MKKERIFAISLIVFLVSMLLVACCICAFSIYKVRCFSLEDYSEFVDTPIGYQDSHLGKITTASDAKKAAVKVFRDVYADDFLMQTVPYIVSYDSENNVWLVQAGKYFIPEWGAHIIIDASDGKILGLWNYKF